MTIQLHARIESPKLNGPQTATVRLDGGPQTAAFVIGEGLTEREARASAALHIRMLLELLEKAESDTNGWLGTVCDGWSMSPVMNPRDASW